jgi:Ca-activated chloride channel homolog
MERKTSRDVLSWVAVCTCMVGCTPIEPESNDPEEGAPPPPAVEAPSVVAPTRPVNPSAAKAEGGVSVEIHPRFTKVHPSKRGTLDVMVRVRAGDAPGEKRPPMDLALVVDRSGSMGGDKIAAAKQAALETLRALDADDLITFISYDDDVAVHASRQPVKSSAGVKRAMLALTPGGGTALGPALEEGLKILGGARRSPEMLAHVLLLSDGLANSGESSPEVLAGWTSAAFAGGVAVSTLGVGLDYNEDLMTKIADAGGGRYHFIEDSDQVSAVVAEEFAGLVSTVARGVTLAVAPGPGIEVRTIEGYPNARDGGEVLAKVGSLSANGKREILVRLDHGAPQGKSMVLGTFTLRFNDALADGAEREIVLEPSVGVTANAAEIEASEDYAVTVRAFELEVAATLQSASVAVERGSFDDARAQLRSKRDDLATEAAQRPDVPLDGMIGELEEALNKVGDAERDFAERKRFQKGYKSKAYGKSKK